MPVIKVAPTWHFRLPSALFATLAPPIQDGMNGNPPPLFNLDAQRGSGKKEYPKFDEILTVLYFLKGTLNCIYEIANLVPRWRHIYGGMPGAPFLFWII